MVDSFVGFLSDYYIWFLVAAGVFLFALVGLLIGSKKNRKKEGGDMLENNAVPVEEMVNGAPVAQAPVSQPQEQQIVEPQMQEVAQTTDTPPVSTIQTPETAAPAVETPVVETPVVAPPVQPVVEQPVINTQNEPVVNNQMPAEPVINIDNNQNPQM